MDEKEKIKAIQAYDQSTALVGDLMPPMWKRIYDRLIEVGFEEPKAFELLKTYILSSNIRFTPGGS